MLRRTPLLSGAAVVVSALLLAGCTPSTEAEIAAEGLRCPEGSECYDPPEAFGDGGAISYEAFEFGFQHVTGVAVEGDVEVTLDNVGEALHNIVIAGANDVGDTIVEAEAGATNAATFNLFSGTYTYFCSVPGHRGAGMEGTLTVYRSAEEAASVAPSPAPAASPTA